MGGSGRPPCPPTLGASRETRAAPRPPTLAPRSTFIRSTSVIRAVQEPSAAETVVREAAQHAVGDRDIPLVARPGLDVPPVSGRAPRSGARDPPLHRRRGIGAEADAARLAVDGVDVDLPGRPQAAEREPRDWLAGRGS